MKFNDIFTGVVIALIVIAVSIPELLEIRAIVLEVISENKNLVEDYKKGKRVFDYFIGQIMKKTRGRANPSVTSKVLQEELDKFL